jgi:inhibitor of KinA sporulation pathway (predicted exonuclease)
VYVGRASVRDFVNVPKEKRAEKIKRKYVKHHLTYEQGDNSPDLAGVWSQLLLVIAGLRTPRYRLLISHTTYDISRVKEGLGEERILGDLKEHNITLGDSVWVAKHIRRNNKDNNLDSLMKEFGVQMKGDRHTALPDAIALSQVIQKMIHTACADVVLYLFAFFAKCWWI